MIAGVARERAVKRMARRVVKMVWFRNACAPWMGIAVRIRGVPGV
jgi:hypothetical protein